MVLCTDEFREAVNRGCPLVLGGPLPHVMAAKAIAFKEALAPSFKTYAHQIVKNAQALAEGIQKRGGKVLTGGTDNHLLVVNVADSFQINGRMAETLLREARLTVNRNAVPRDVNGPWYTSGIRLGTPAVTTLGMKEAEMDEIARLMVELLKEAKPEIVEKTGLPSKARAAAPASALRRAQEGVAALLAQFPLYSELLID
jgi:glycine hydroxymethyltransferase